VRSLRSCASSRRSLGAAESAAEERNRATCRRASGDVCRIRAWCAASTSASPRTRINAERAVEIEIDEIAESFASMRDAYLAARIEDIRVVGNGSFAT